jgi:hypothetical protein
MSFTTPRTPILVPFGPLAEAVTDDAEKDDAHSLWTTNLAVRRMKRCRPGGQFVTVAINLCVEFWQKDWNANGLQGGSSVAIASFQVADDRRAEPTSSMGELSPPCTTSSSGSWLCDRSIEKKGPCPNFDVQATGPLASQATGDERPTDFVSQVNLEPTALLRACSVSKD